MRILAFILACTVALLVVGLSYGASNPAETAFAKYTAAVNQKNWELACALTDPVLFEANKVNPTLCIVVYQQSLKSFPAYRVRKVIEYSPKLVGLEVSAKRGSECVYMVAPDTKQFRVGEFAKSCLAPKKSASSSNGALAA